VRDTRGLAAPYGGVIVRSFGKRFRKLAPGRFAVNCVVDGRICTIRSGADPGEGFLKAIDLDGSTAADRALVAKVEHKLRLGEGETRIVFAPTRR
jgi:hypothetical protein